ncbi:MAG: SRPBCC family protein [Deltaproteobacteria bacterium]|nr:SRPBCC family protein [Deltaproteobacteria bacterium]MBW2629963.1 SRPBCC family protein [Deltaproteobacteria bacterium]
MQNTFQTLRRTTLQIALAGALASASTLGLMPSHAAAVEAHVENAGIFTAQIPVDGSNIATGQAVIVVDRPIEEVLRIVLDYANYVRFMPNFTKSKVLAQRGSRAIVYMEVSVAKGMYTLYGQLDLAERPQDGVSRVVAGRLMDGNIDAFDASFKLTPTDDGARTEIDFRIYVDPDLPLPSSVFSRENERAAGRTVRALRARVAETPSDST